MVFTIKHEYFVDLMEHFLILEFDEIMSFFLPGNRSLTCERSKTKQNRNCTETGSLRI